MTRRLHCFTEYKSEDVTCAWERKLVAFKRVATCLKWFQRLIDEMYEGERGRKLWGFKCDTQKRDFLKI